MEAQAKDAPSLLQTVHVVREEFSSRLVDIQRLRCGVSHPFRDELSILLLAREATGDTLCSE